MSESLAGFVGIRTPVKPKPVNNARTDKLGSGFWNRWTDPAHRCLIPASAYAEAVGQKGRMTEAWMNVPGESLFAVAGIWRPSAEWGDCYSMVMTEAAGGAAAVHSRMPVILALGDHASWLEQEMPDALDLCRPWGGCQRRSDSRPAWRSKSRPVVMRVSMSLEQYPEVAE